MGKKYCNSPFVARKMTTATEPKVLFDSIGVKVPTKIGEFELSLGMLLYAFLVVVLAQIGLVKNLAVFLYPLLCTQALIYLAHIAILAHALIVIVSHEGNLDLAQKENLASMLLFNAIILALEAFAVYVAYKCCAYFRAYQKLVEYNTRQSMVDEILSDMDDVVIFDRSDSLRGTKRQPSFIEKKVRFEVTAPLQKANLIGF